MGSSVPRSAVVILVLASGASHAAELVLHLRFDDGAQSQIAADSSGNGYDGTLVNMDPATDSVSGQAGLALDFDGTDDYVEVPDNADLSFGSRCFSVSYWFNKLATSSAFDNLYGVSKWRTGASPGQNEWVLNIGYGVDTDRPTFLIESGTTFHQIVSPAPVSLGVWHHIVGVRGANSMRLFIDGVLVAAEDAIPDGVAVNDKGLNLRVAVNQLPAPLFYTRAQFDDVQIYDFALGDGGVGVGETAGGEVAFLFANPGDTVTPAAPAVGRIPDGNFLPGMPLLVSKEPDGDVTLTWGPSCLADNFTDYSVYEGTLGDFASHQPLQCSTGGNLTATFAPAASESYYLVVPKDGCYAGSYGIASTGIPRPASNRACASAGFGSCTP